MFYLKMKLSSSDCTTQIASLANYDITHRTLHSTSSETLIS